MPYELSNLIADCREALAAGPLDRALPEISKALRQLVRNPVFAAETFAPDASAGRRELYHDADHDFYVLAHVQEPGKKGKPHDHGDSWAVYGNVSGVTIMTEWRRANEDPDHVALQEARTYDLGPGDANAFGPRVLHSTEHKGKAFVIRVTGTDLDAIPRYHFRSKSDRLLEKA
jgi:predicted metal-dependent enzyme (double-stranded beta helix superfamily)